MSDGASAAFPPARVTYPQEESCLTCKLGIKGSLWFAVALLGITIITMSGLGLAGYVSRQLLCSVNIGAVGLAFIGFLLAPASGLIRSGYIKSAVVFALVFLLFFSNFLVVNALGLLGKLDHISICWITLGSPVLLALGVAVAASCYRGYRTYGEMGRDLTGIRQVDDHLLSIKGALGEQEALDAMTTYMKGIDQYLKERREKEGVGAVTELQMNEELQNYFVQRQHESKLERRFLQAKRKHIDKYGGDKWERCVFLFRQKVARSELPKHWVGVIPPIFRSESSLPSSAATPYAPLPQLASFSSLLPLDHHSLRGGADRGEHKG